MIRPPWIVLLSLGLPVVAAGDMIVPAPAPAPRVELLATGLSIWSGFGPAAVDLDGDGDLDLVNLPSGATSSQGDPHAYWMENLGGRQFAPLRMVHVAPTRAGEWLSGMPVVMNLTGDAKPEIFVSRTSGESQEWQEPLVLRPALQGSGQVPLPVEGTPLAPGGAGLGWQVVDLDADGQGELISVSMAAGESAKLRILDRQGDGSFSNMSGPLDTGLGFFFDLYALEAVDVDGDGDLDLSVATGGFMLVFERTGAREFGAVPLHFGGNHGESEGIEFGRPWVDLNGDGRPDALSFFGEWRENLGGLNFAIHTVPPIYHVLRFDAYEIEPRAGLPALVHTVLRSEAGVYERVAIPFDAVEPVEPVEREVLPLVDEDFPAFTGLKDLDGDGQRDLLYSYSKEGVSYYNSRILAVAWGSAAGLSAPQVLHAGPGIDHRVFAADFNRDKAMDLLMGPDALGRYQVRFNAGKAAAAAPAGTGEWRMLEGLELPGTKMAVVGVARIDRDKIADLLCSYIPEPLGEAGPRSALVVVRGRKDGSFYKPVFPAGGLDFTPDGITAGDFVDWDRDGDLDLVGDGFWRENVKGTFPPGQGFLVGLGTMTDFLDNRTTVGGTITGDLDGDKRPDIISLAYGEGEPDPMYLLGKPPKKMLIGFGDGRGGGAQTLELPIQVMAKDSRWEAAMPGAVAIADMNGDKLPDLWIREVVATDFFDQQPTVIGNRWLRNPGRGSRNVAEWVSQPLAETVTPGLAFADFDGDRKPEWVSPYGFLQASRKGPLSSEGYDFTGGLDFSNNAFRQAVDYDADGDADFVIGGGPDSPLLVLLNPSADHLKKRGRKPKAVKWAGQGLGVVR